MTGNFGEKSYLDLVRHILTSGEDGDDRTGVGTRSVFGATLSFDMNDGFPLLTTKKIHFKNIITELIWFLQGDTNISYLHKHGCHIWDEWADEDGELGPIYGKQWRRWSDPSPNLQYYKNKHTFAYKVQPLDQIKLMVQTLQKNPNSRRNLVIAYNPAEIPDKAPPACHTMFQVYARNGKLDLQMYQRSADLMIGVPYNIASYSLLLHMLAQVTGLKANRYNHVFGDVHIYNNHFEGARKQLERTPKPFPTLKINEKVDCIFNFRHDDFTLEGYNPDKFIKFPIAV